MMPQSGTTWLGQMRPVNRDGLPPSAGINDKTTLGDPAGRIRWQAAGVPLPFKKARAGQGPGQAEMTVTGQPPDWLRTEAAPAPCG
jgi:hypothetical protein